MEKSPYEQNVVFKKCVTNTTRMKATWSHRGKFKKENGFNYWKITKYPSNIKI